MNIVDLISNQLSGDVLGQLGGLVGADRAQTQAASSAAVPALLSIFGKLASTTSGADRLATAMGGLDLGMLGNLAGALGGGQASALGGLGGNLLGSLLGGGNATTAVVETIASFTGLKPGIMKTLLGYLAPIVLGVIAKQFTGRPDAAGVSRLFSEQSANIRGALPKGLALPDLAFGAVSGGRPGEPARHGGRGPEPAAAGLPGWLLPLLVLAAAGLGWYLWQEGQRRAVAIREEVAKQGPVVVDRTEVIEREGRKLVDTVTETVEIDPRFLEAGTVAGTLFKDLTTILGGVRDEAGAEAAVPALRDLAPLLATLEEETARLPADEKPAFAKVIDTNVGLLRKVIDAAMAIPGVEKVLGPVVTPMMETLAKLAT